MGRSPCCFKVGLKRGPWSTKEDTLLTDYIQRHGERLWRDLPKNAGLLRCGKSCRLRWMNYLRPGIKRGNITEDEEDLIVRLHGLLGNRWSLIAGRLEGRTDNEIKNHWNTHLQKKFNAAGGVHPHRDLPKPEPKPKPESKKKKISRDTTSKNKVYLPKPIRVSSDFSRTSSYESLLSGGNSGSGATWPRLLEGDYGCGDEFQMLSGGYNVLPALIGHASSGMLDRVYDEYLQLL